jgi:hypothetical protein
METVVTSKIDSHHTNPNYKCALIPMLQFREFHLVIDWQKRKVVKCDLMPTENFALELNSLLCDISPTYPKRLLAQAVSVEVPENTTPKKRIEKLEDVLL